MPAVLLPALEPFPDPFPEVVEIDGIAVTAFHSPQCLFERLVRESRRAGQTLVHYLNIHVANTAFAHPRLKRILQQSDLVYCDGAGIVIGAKLLEQTIPTRLTAADWFLDMLAYFAERQCRVYLLGGEPGVTTEALRSIESQVPNHTVVGAHHGYILASPDIERVVIEEINALQPDILIVGFGTPLQECWMEDNRARLQVPVIYAIGAVLDFVSGRVSRCPRWMGNTGLEWLYRLYTEPVRLLGRYVIGNPWFLARLATQAVGRQLKRMLGRPSALSHPAKRTAPIKKRFQTYGKRSVENDRRTNHLRR